MVSKTPKREAAKNLPPDVQKRLISLRDYLREVAKQTIPEDVTAWGEAALTKYLDKQEPTLDRAFGVNVDRRREKSPDDGRHADWVINAWSAYQDALAKRGKKSKTAVAAEIGRAYGLGGREADTAPDGAVASEFERILLRYWPLISRHLASKIAGRMSSTKRDTESD